MRASSECRRASATVKRIRSGAIGEPRKETGPGLQWDRRCGPLLFPEGLRRARRQRHLKSVQRVSDRRVIADDRAELDNPLLAEPSNRLCKCCVREPLGVDQLGNNAMDEGLVVSREAGRGAGADALDRRSRDAGFYRERRMRMPFEIDTQVPSG